MNKYLKLTNYSLRLLKANSENVIKQSIRGLAEVKDVFGKDEKVEKSMLLEKDFEDSVDAGMAQVERLVRVKAYKPPSNVESEIKSLCKETFGKDFNEKTYQGLSFSNPLHKFQVLSRCVGIFKHNIPNTTLNEIKTVKDLIDYYMIEQKDTSTLEDLKNSDNLPKNLHINLEYTRFDPEKDKFFNGRDAYQNRDTKVTSLWYSKKYKEVKKQKKLFEK